ncbi:MAG: (2Fe-2S)-binding protein [Clostridia bacterium]
MSWMKFMLNGNAVTIEEKPGELLVDMLRERFALTGTKAACREGECGACTVLLDGAPVNSCMVLSSQVAGHSILTIEGLAAQDGTLDPVQQAFLDAGAVQCGFCTPGMVMTTKALLDKNPNPTREEAAKALSGNICRCTGYIKIIDAVMQAAELLRIKEN